MMQPQAKENVRRDELMNPRVRLAADTTRFTRRAKRIIMHSCMKELAGTKRLHLLILIGTMVTDTGIKQLQEQLPNCEVRANGSQ